MHRKTVMKPVAHASTPATFFSLALFLVVVLTPFHGTAELLDRVADEGVEEQAPRRITRRCEVPRGHAQLLAPVGGDGGRVHGV